VRGASCYEFELATSRSFNGSSVIWSNVSSGPNAGKHCRPVTMSFELAKDPSAVGAGGDGDTGKKTIKQTTPAIRIPAVSVNLTLPWFNESGPRALYAHVRSVTAQGASSWSAPFAFDMRWATQPTPQVARPGVIRWMPVEGATGYEVWYGGHGSSGFLNKIV